MSNNIRIEEDLLGTREVPADAYYGVHTLRAIENFYISNNKISDIPEFVRGMVMVKKAAAMANKELQTIPKSVANAIIAACDEVLNNGKCMIACAREVNPEIEIILISATSGEGMDQWLNWLETQRCA